MNISFSAGVGAAGQKVTVRLGEQLLSNGSVKYQMESKNTYEDTWTLSGGSASASALAATANANAVANAAPELGPFLSGEHESESIAPGIIVEFQTAFIPMMGLMLLAVAVSFLINDKK